MLENITPKCIRESLSIITNHVYWIILCIKEKQPTIKVTNNDITTYIFPPSPHHEPETYLGGIVAYIMDNGMNYVNDSINRYVYINGKLITSPITTTSNTTPSEGLEGLRDVGGNDSEQQRQQLHLSENLDPVSETDSARTNVPSDLSEQSESDSEVVEHNKNENINHNPIDKCKFNEVTRHEDSNNKGDEENFKTEKREESKQPPSPKIYLKSNDNEIDGPTVNAAAAITTTTTKTTEVVSTTKPISTNVSDDNIDVITDQKENDRHIIMIKGNQLRQ